MVKKTVDPKLEPILDKIEEFDPERADRLRDSYGEEPDALPHGILSGVVIGRCIANALYFCLSDSEATIRYAPIAVRRVRTCMALWSYASIAVQRRVWRTYLRVS